MSSPIASSRLAAALAAVAAALALAACGGSDTADPDAVEAGLLSLAQQTADVESVSCPDDISTDTGTEFECTVTNASGEEVPVVSTVTGIDGEDVLFEVQTIDGVDITK
jgi:hypothetical protein